MTIFVESWTNRPESARSDADPIQPLIKITLSGPDAVLDAQDAPAVAPLLRIRRQTWIAGDRGLRVAPQDIHFGWYEGFKYRFPAKLALWVRDALKCQGIRAWIHASSSVPAEGDWDASPPALKALFHHRIRTGLGGIVPAGRGLDPRTLIPMLISLFPSRRIFVATPTNCDIAAWVTHLERAGLNRPILTVTAGDRIWHPSAVVVGSFEVLDRCRSEDFGLALATDVAPIRVRSLVTIRRRSWGTMDWPAFRLLRDYRVPSFGFLPATVPELSDSERLTLMSWFGPLRAAPKREPRVRVRVACVPCGARHFPTDPLAAKRLMWTDDTRNEAIARLAESVAAETPRRVVVLTGSDVQIDHLARRLTGWTVALRSAREILAHRAIITEAWLERGRFGSEVVIDARGWGPLRPADFDEAVEAEVIDLPVTEHPEFQRSAADRLANYRRYGWSGASTAESAIP
jgi:hypothetical protein